MPIGIPNLVFPLLSLLLSIHEELLIELEEKAVFL